jgi:hypothetical protein
MPKPISHSQLPTVSRRTKLELRTFECPRSAQVNLLGLGHFLDDFIDDNTIVDSHVPLENEKSMHSW